MKKINVNYNFYDDVDDVEYVEGTKLFIGDPDALSETLYEYHHLLWGKREPLTDLRHPKQKNILKLPVEISIIKQKEYGLKLPVEISLGADNFVALYMGKNKKNGKLVLKYKAMREKDNNAILHKQKELRPNWETERIKYTIGGSIVYPKFNGGINQTRGKNKKIADRIDITLACIKMWYNANNGEDGGKKKDNPLWDCLNILQNKIFFSLFGTGEEGFKNYINFFLFDDFVNKKYEVKDLCNNYAADETKNDAPVHNEDKYRKPDCAKVIDDNVLGKTNNLPDNAEEYANLYHNLIWAIKQRTERIRNFAKDKKLIDETRQAESFEITFKLSPEE